MQLLEIYLHKIQKYINLKLVFIVFISIQTDVFFSYLISNLNQELT